jgi:hypothetical protein
MFGWLIGPPHLDETGSIGPAFLTWLAYLEKAPTEQHG